MLTLNRLKFFNRYLPLALSIILIMVAIGGYYIFNKSNTAESAWFSPSWSYRTPITIDHTKVNTATGTTTPLSNFPVLISVTDPNLRTISNGGFVASSTGADILFTDSTGNTQIPYERETYASSTGQLIAWVKVASLSSVADTTIYIYYGNSTAGLADQQSPTNVWDTNFKSVWHMPNGTNLSGADSTGVNNASVVGNPAAAAGKIDGGASFTSSGNNYMGVSDNASLRIAQKITISAWVNPSSRNANGSLIVQKRHFNSPATGYNYGFWLESNTGKEYFEFNDGSYRTSVGTTAVPLNTWTYVTVVVDETASTKLTFYQNGSLDSTPSYAGTMPSSGTEVMQIGNYGQFNSGIYQFNGTIDELRISNTPRSADWVKTEYVNQGNPGSVSTPGFYTYGSQTAYASRESGRPNTSFISHNAWYNNAWPNRIAITIDHTKVASSSATTLTNFPVLISTTTPILATIANGGGVASSTGADIVFTAGDGFTKIPHEIETYASTTGQLIAWVKVPTLSQTVDTVLYLYYGNTTSGLANQQNVTGVWDSNYKGVWHLPNGTSLTANDSVLNGHNGTLSGSPLPSAVSGQIDGAANFNGTSGYINTTSDFIGTSAGTYSAWVYARSEGETGQGSIIDNRGIVFGLGQTFTARTITFTSDDLTHSVGSASGAIQYNQWYLVTATRDASGVANIYINGALSGAANQNSGTPQAGVTNVVIGNTSFDSRTWDGYIDEARISNTVRSADWIKTEYNNQNSPSTFETFGVPQALSGFGVAGWSGATGWTSRKKLIINHEKVSGSTALVNFPVLVSITDNDLRTTANGGSVASTTGADIMFTQSDGSTQLSYERELYTATTGNLVAWVKIPSLSPTTDTVIYIYYGNSTAGLADQQNKTAVWDSSYAGVWHMADTLTGAGQTVTDSTGQNNGSSTGSWTASSQINGITDGSLNFNVASSTYVTMPQNNSLKPTTAITFSLWVKSITASNNQTLLMDWDGGSANTYGINWKDNGSLGLQGSTISVRTNTFINGLGNLYVFSPTVGNWYHLVGSYDSTTGVMNQYVNGALVGTSTTTPGDLISYAVFGAQRMFIGSDNGSSIINANVDEVRVENVARSTDWIKTEYNNQASPSTFVSIGQKDAASSAPSNGSNVKVRGRNVKFR